MEEIKDQEIANLPMPKQKKPVNRAQLNEQTLLQDNKGLKKLYNECTKFAISGDTKKDLKKLINLYKEWHFGVAPKFEFNYFVQKCQVLGTKAPIRSFMTRIRKVHTGQTTWEDIENPANPYENIADDQVSFAEDERKLTSDDDVKKSLEKSGQVDPDEEDFLLAVQARQEVEEMEYLLSLDQGKRKAQDEFEIQKMQKLDDDDIFF